MTETLEDREPAAAGELRTFLIADVRGYTRFTVEHGDEAAAELAAHFAAIARQIVSAYEGQVVELRGDEALAVFSSARQALRAAVDLQGRFAEETERNRARPLHVGIGLDAGEAIPFEAGYRGGALNLAARLCALAGPGEVLVSEGVVHLARKVEELEYVERGAVQLKGFVDAVRVVEIHPLSRQDVGQSSVAAQSSEATDRTVQERSLPIGGFLGALPAGPLVARTEDLGKILSAADAVAGGSGRLVLLAGEPGVGKTRLAQEVTLQVRNRRFLLAAGRCYESRQAVPFYPFVEALAMLYAAVPGEIRGQVPRRWPYVSRLLPNEDLGVPRSPGLTLDQDEHERLFWAVTGFLQAIAGDAPVALMLDDLHWADSSSLELLQHLARHTRADRVLLLGTYRDVEVRRQHPLEQALRELNREDLVQRVAVRRLGKEGTAALVATSFDQTEVSEEFASLLYRHTEGNPFFVQEVLRALVERGDIYREDGHWERREIEELSVPESVRSAIGERLSRLSEESQEILYEASVLGQSFGFNDLQSLADRSEEEVEAALEEARAAGLMVELGRDQYGFNHALTQQALYAELPARRKRRLHLAAGEARERLSERQKEGRAAELAWHFLEADDAERALPYAILAGDQAEGVFAHAEAERHYRNALDVMRELGEAAREAEVLEKLGAVLVRSSRFTEALELAERAAGMYRRLGDRDGEARVGPQIGQAYFGRLTPDEGLARVGELIELLQGQVSPQRLAALYEAQALLFFGSGRYREQLKAAERLVELAVEAGDQYTLALAKARLAMALSPLGRVDESARVAEETIPHAEASGNLDALWMALISTSESYEYQGSLQKAMVDRKCTLEVLERLSDRGYIAFALLNVAQTLVLLGEWQAARRHVERASEMTGPLASWYAAYPPIHLGGILFLEGDWEGAARHLEEGIAIVKQSGDLQALRWGELCLAEIELRRGQPEAAIARLEPLLDRPGLEEVTVNALLPVLAEAQLSLGQVEKAEEMITGAVKRTAAQNDRLNVVRVLRVQGLVLARQERWEEAKRVFEEGLSLARGMPYPYAVARALYELGVMDQSWGKEDQARERLEEALAVSEELGAKWDIERTKKALAGLR